MQFELIKDENICEKRSEIRMLIDKAYNFLPTASVDPATRCTRQERAVIVEALYRSVHDCHPMSTFIS